jgi:hypothetical protein
MRGTVLVPTVPSVIGASSSLGGAPTVQDDKRLLAGTPQAVGSAKYAIGERSNRDSHVRIAKGIALFLSLRAAARPFVRRATSTNCGLWQTARIVANAHRSNVASTGSPFARVAMPPRSTSTPAPNAESIEPSSAARLPANRSADPAGHERVRLRIASYATRHARSRLAMTAHSRSAGCAIGTCCNPDILAPHAARWLPSHRGPRVASRFARDATEAGRAKRSDHRAGPCPHLPTGEFSSAATPGRPLQALVGGRTEPRGTKLARTR